MKANEFVKYLKNGIESAKELMEVRPYMIEGMGIDLSDLKRLVESWELVNEFDDIEQARSWIPDMDDEMPYQVRGSDKRFFKGQLIEAIADVESCQ